MDPRWRVFSSGCLMISYRKPGARDARGRLAAAGKNGRERTSPGNAAAIAPGKLTGIDSDLALHPGLLKTTGHFKVGYTGYPP
jgi:hypothetical protein